MSRLAVSVGASGQGAEYAREEIRWDSTVFPDNHATIELIEKRPLGLLPLLDSECKRGASASDGDAFVRAINKHHA
jgi:myosin heavy subunit